MRTISDSRIFEEIGRSLLYLSAHRQRKEGEKIDNQDRPVDWNVKNFRKSAK
jgi:hypothetical protein